jgi:hypothetical protein
MTLKRTLGVSTIAAGIGLAAVFGIGTASADPGQPCNAPGTPACQDQHRDNNGPRQPNNGPGQQNWQGRGVDQARGDHQPFNWNGQQVTPMPDGNGHGWGFWFLGQWIGL